MPVSIGVGLVLIGLSMVIRSFRLASNYRYILLCILGTLLASGGLDILLGLL